MKISRRAKLRGLIEDLTPLVQFLSPAFVVMAMLCFGTCALRAQSTDIGGNSTFTFAPDLPKQLAEAQAKADFEIIKRVDAQIASISAQANAAAAPLANEKQEAINRRCVAEKIELSKCEVNALAATVKAKSDPPTKPNEAPAKPAQ